MSFDLEPNESVSSSVPVGSLATVHVVGGVAISCHLPHADRRTQEIDGVTTDDQVADIVAPMADELGLPEGWLNGSARPFLSPSPADTLTPRPRRRRR